MFLGGMADRDPPSESPCILTGQRLPPHPSATREELLHICGVPTDGRLRAIPTVLGTSYRAARGRMRRWLRVPPPERASLMRKMHIDATFLTSLFPRGPSNGWPLFGRHPFPLVHAAPACLPVCCQCRSPFPVTISPAALYRGTCPCSVPPRAPARGSGALPVTTAALPLPHSNGVVHAGCARSVGRRPAGDPAVLAIWSSTSTSGLPPTAGRQPPPSPPAAHRGGATTSQQDRQPAPLPTKNPRRKIP